MNLRFITPDLHGLLDYLAATALVIAPFVLQLEQHSIFVHWFSVAAGVGLVLYSLLTDYTLSVKGIFSFKAHLVLDLLASLAFLAVAFLHGGTVLSVWYCVVMGGGVLVVIALSRVQTDDAEASNV